MDAGRWPVGLMISRSQHPGVLAPEVLEDFVPAVVGAVAGAVMGQALLPVVVEGGSGNLEPLTEFLGEEKFRGLGFGF